MTILESLAWLSLIWFAGSILFVAIWGLIIHERDKHNYITDGRLYDER